MKLHDSKNERIDKKVPNKKGVNIYAALSLVFGILLILILLVDYRVVHDNLFGGTPTFNKLFGIKSTIDGLPSVPAITPLPVDSETPSESPSPSTTAPQVYPTTNPNPVTTCTSTYTSCAGQSIQLPQNECSAITCCQLGNSWSVYPNQEQCKQAQNAQNNTPTQTSDDDSNTNYVIPTPIPQTPLVSCQTSTGTYQLTQSQCDTAQQRDQQLQASIAQQDQQGYNNCVSVAEGTYQSEINSYNHSSEAYGGDGGMETALENSAATEEQELLNQCEQDYPNH